jgi:hypothetical protein
LLATSRANFVFAIWKHAVKNPSPDPAAIVALLWREEALDFLEELGIAGGVRWKRRAEIYSRLVTLMRGDAVRGKATSHAQETRPGREQWHGHAQLLCDDENLFYGEGFSWGDAFIHEKSLDSKSYGSYEIWLRAGINHHMTVVSRQIANLGVS